MSSLNALGSMVRGGNSSSSGNAGTMQHSNSGNLSTLKRVNRFSSHHTDLLASTEL